MAREVMEEVGIEIETPEYHSSQPWPFPASIMLGFSAQARTTKLQVQLEELESAHWFSRSFLQNSPEDETFRLPLPAAFLKTGWQNGSNKRHKSSNTSL